MARQRYHLELSPIVLHRQLTSAHHRSPSPSSSPSARQLFFFTPSCYIPTASRFDLLGFGRALDFWAKSKVRLPMASPRHQPLR
jgi:hypothetical protein